MQKLVGTFHVTHVQPHQKKKQTCNVDPKLIQDLKPEHGRFALNSVAQRPGASAPIAQRHTGTVVLTFYPSLLYGIEKNRTVVIDSGCEEPKKKQQNQGKIATKT